jgi:TPR repeat protein
MSGMQSAAYGLIGAVGPAGVTCALVVLGLLSRRLGAVTRMPPHYRWLYVAASLSGLSALVRVVSSGHQDARLELIYALAFALGVTVGLAAAWHYWSWLFGERRDERG